MKYDVRPIAHALFAGYLATAIDDNALARMVEKYCNELEDLALGLAMEHGRDTDDVPDYDSMPKPIALKADMLMGLQDELDELLHRHLERAKAAK